MRPTLCRTSAVFAILLLLSASSANARVVPTVAVRFAGLWSFHVQSQALLRDLGYSSEYLFEFHDEEELTVRSIAPDKEIAEGTLRTILDGQLAYVTVRLAREELPLHVVLNDDDVVVGWIISDGKLKVVDMSREEILRRVDLMMSLLTVTRTRLGLHHFLRVEEAVISVRADQFDSLTLTPGMGSILRYSIEQPATPATKETLTVQMGNQLWTITYAKDTIVVAMGLEGAQVSKVYQLGSPDARERMLLAAIRLLRRARVLFGTSVVAKPLP